MNRNLWMLLALAAARCPQIAAAEAPASVAELASAKTPNEQLVANYYGLLSRGALDEAGTMLGADFRCEAVLPGLKPGRDSFRAFLASVHSAFPDAHFEPQLYVSQGDYVVCRFRFTGTHRARFLSLRPTHRPTDVFGIDIWTIRDGKLAELRGNFDVYGMLVQLGLVPAIKEPEPAGKSNPAGSSGAPR